MLKAYSEARNRCYLHPHRQAETKCERCSTPLCAECARTYEGKQLCEHCVEELSYIEATKPTTADRIRGFFTSLRNTVIIAVIAVAVIAGLFVVLKPFFNQPLTPEELARFRYAAGGTFQTPEGINVNSTVLGAKVVSFTSERKGYEATHLINEYVSADYPGWRSATATFPQDVVVEQQDVSAVSKVILTQQPGEPADTEVKDFEVDASTTGPNGPWVKLGQWQLSPASGAQRFTFPVAQAHWLRLRILSNDGSSDYTSLGEFDAYVVPASAVTPTP
jgi:hypothetical protein